MAKFLKLPVTGNSGPSVTIGIDMIATIKRGTDTTTIIHYSAGSASDDIITLTHTEPNASNIYAMRDAIQDAIVNLHSSNWRETIQTLNLASIKTADGSLMAITGVVLS
mgnify:CR=1 FL=1|tara:strand:- start:1236 stop:1562 length:327 start_codon:yes stop_codon:yes gene_type:complete